MKKRYWVRIGIFFLCTLLLTAGISASVLAEQPVIGVVVKTMIGDPFQVNIANFAKARGEALGAKVETYGASGHAAIEEQVSIVESLIAKKVNAIVLVATDSKGLAPAVNKSTKAGIPVILADSGVEGAEYVTIIQTDNVRGSALAAKYAAILLNGKGNVAQIEGQPGHETARLRVKGFHAEIANHPGLKLVSSITGNWSTPGAVAATEAILEAHPDVNLIFASSDMMGVGVAEVLRRKKREDVLLVSFDGITEGTDLILQGKSCGDVAQNAKAMGERSVEIAMEIISGKKKPADYPKFIDSGTLLVHPWNVGEYRKNFLGLTD